MERVINYLPFMQIVKEGRAYILLLPFNAPFEETQDALKEMIAGVDKEKAVRDDIRLKAEIENQAKEA